jgi:hypothetical protein
VRRSRTRHDPKLAALPIVAVLVLSLPVGAADLGKQDRAALFAAAGFTPRGDQYVRCADDTTAFFMPGSIEITDLNQDGRPEAWVRESSSFCYGATAEAFVLLTQDDRGAWVKLIDEAGVALPLETEHNGWPDIEVGGPGAGPFPVYQHDGTSYQRRE